MKHDQFDNLTRQLATSTSRRQALKTLGGAMLAALFPILESRPAWGQRGTPPPGRIRCTGNALCERVFGRHSYCGRGFCYPSLSQTCAGIPGYDCHSECNQFATVCGKRESPTFDCCDCRSTVEGSVVCASFLEDFDGCNGCTSSEQCKVLLQDDQAVCITGSCCGNACATTRYC